MELAIAKIEEDLNRLSSMNWVVEDYVMNLQQDIHNRVEWLCSLCDTCDIGKYTC